MGSSDDANGQVVERTRRGVQPGFGDVQIACGGLQVAVAEQQLDAAQIGTGIEQMGGKGMAQGLLVLLMICTQQRFAIGSIRSTASKLK